MQSWSSRLAVARNDPEAVQRLSFMRTAAERGAKLTGQLLAFSRRHRLEPKPLNLNEAVENMHDLLQSSLGGSVKIETRLRPMLWPALVDPTQIELAVLNLASGRLTIETGNVTILAPERTEDPAPGEYVMIAVNDTGWGM
jgi:signal transduction histidine kinase